MLLWGLTTLPMFGADDIAGSSMRNALTRLLEVINVLGEIRTARTIFIKVGLIESVEWSRHVTATPAFLEALVNVLKEESPDAQILIGDGSGHERDTDLLLRWTGLHPLLRKYPEISFIDLNTDDLVPVNVENPYTLRQLLLPRTLLESDVTISLAKLKTGPLDWSLARYEEPLRCNAGISLWFSEESFTLGKLSSSHLRYLVNCTPYFCHH